MQKNTSLVCYLTITILISLSPFAYGEKEDCDPNYIIWLKQNSEQGNAGAQNNLGLMFENGNCVPQDYKEAVKWYKKAAEQGDAFAQFNLGLMFDKGRGVPQDYKEAVKWFTKAAEQGIVDAQYNLGLKLYQGKSVPQDYKEAAKWWTKAAEQGVADAQNNLGVMFSEGKGVPQDYKEAVKWCTKAAEQGIAAAQFNLGTLFSEGKGVPQDYKEAVKWYAKAAEQRYAAAQFNLGTLFSEGKGVPQDYKEAVKWYTKAAELDYVPAQYNLSTMYWNGAGVPQDCKEAVRWCTKAAELGSAVAQCKLGVMYDIGDCTPEDYIEAYKWYILAAAQGEKSAATFRDSLRNKMSSLQIAEAQRLAREFLKQQTANKENTKANPSADIIPTLKATGTAFCIHPGGFFVTAAHVVQGANGLKIGTEKGTVPARVVSADEGLDIALLRADSNGFTAIPLVSSSAVKTGEKVFTIGFPNIEVQGSEAKFTEGVISSLSGIANNPRFFQISVAVQPGNSGGPLVDEKGRVIGIVNAKLDDIAALVVTGSVPQNVNYAVKSSFILPLLENVEGLKEMPKPTELSREEAIQKAKSAVGLVLCY